MVVDATDSYRTGFAIAALLPLSAVIAWRRVPSAA